MLIGSAINIWYNLTNIDPLLTPAQRAIFVRTVTIFNLTVYPVVGAIWAWLVLSLLGPYREQMRGGIRDPERRLRAQRRVVTLRRAPALEPLPPQHVKGHHAPVEVLRLAEG